MGAVTPRAIGTSTAAAAVFDIHIDRNAETPIIPMMSDAGLRPARVTNEMAAR
jgi:hypothetical protein